MIEGFPGDRVAKALDVDGIDFCVIYGPEYDMWLNGIDPELQAAMVRAYNRWGAEMRESSDGRVLTCGPVPLGDVSRAVEEIQYAYDELGIRCFWARPNYPNHRNLGDRYYDPIYELLQDLDVRLRDPRVHGAQRQTEGVDRFDTFTEWHTVVHAHEAQNACLSMIVNGVFERFPRLRCAYMEAGCGWLPSWLHRIDEHLELAGDWRVPRAHHERHGVLQAQLLDHDRVRGSLRGRRDPLARRRPDPVGERLPPSRLEVPGTVQYFLDLDPT